MITIESELGTATLKPRRPASAELCSPQSPPAPPVPAYARPRLLFASGLRRSIAGFRARQRAAVDYPEALGATDHELARLSVNRHRVANSVRDEHTRLFDLTVARYR